MPTVREYDLASWMGADGKQTQLIAPSTYNAAILTHTNTRLDNSIVWSEVREVTVATYVSGGYTGSMAHLNKVTPTYIDVNTGNIISGQARDPHPYWQWYAYGLAYCTLQGYTDPDNRGDCKAKGDCGAYSGSIPVIIDGVCYWVEIGKTGNVGFQVPRCVRQVLIDAGFSVV